MAGKVYSWFYLIILGGQHEILDIGHGVSISEQGLQE